MGSDIGEALRKLVIERAQHRCEYCLLHEDDAYFSHCIDHIISRKHGGRSEADNLAYACFRCNVWKGSDIGSLDPQTGRIVPLFGSEREFDGEPILRDFLDLLKFDELRVGYRHPFGLQK